MALISDAWEALPDDKPIVLTKGDIDNIMTSMLQVQLSIINTQGLVRSMRERDDARYEDFWNKIKLQIRETQNSMVATLRQIAKNNEDQSDD